MWSFLPRTLRHPGLHYLVLGAVLLTVRAAVVERGRNPSARPRIVITAAEHGELQRELRAKLGRLPTPEEEKPLLQYLIDDEILHREAVARGLDRDNEVVRDRVVQSMRLLADDPQVPDETLYREAVGIGLDRRDLIVRRHLATIMRLLAVAPARAEATSDADLTAMLERDHERFRLPATTSMRHVFVSAARGTAAEDTARRLRDELRAAPIAPADAAPPGDPFPLGHHLTDRSDRDLDAIFGGGFARALAGVPLGSWEGPLRSVYGVHLVWVERRVPQRMPDLDAVRTQVGERLRRERGDRRLQEWLAVRRQNYDVTVEAPPASPPSVAAPVDGLSLPRAAVFVGD